MKNKKLYKYFLTSIGEVIAAILLTYITAIILEIIAYYIPWDTTSKLSFYFWYLLVGIRNGIFGEILKVSIVLVIFISFYFLITYKKTKSLANIIYETEIMANGDLDRVIEVEAKGPIKDLAENINSISKQLKHITTLERNEQKTKNDLITNVSHDLRTPLTSIIGYLELIDRDKYKDEVALRYYVNIVYEKAKSLNLLINDLFELTKMQNNTINLDKREINLVELLGQVIACFEYQFNCANMKLRINFSNDKLIMDADAEKLVRAFENLLSNSIKYGKEGYYVDIVTKLKDKIAVIQIINYGESIPEIHLPYIFDRFYRIEKSRNSNVGGSGLGLAITKNIIELHNGSILAYSDDNKTVFEVNLPVK